MNNNKLMIAAAGSGKTSFIVDEASSEKSNKVLITTFTIANEEQIRKKIIKKNGFVPENITIQTWFSFLLQHGARPYQGHLYEKDIKGLLLVNGQSAQYKANGKTISYSEEKAFEKHYFTENQKIYSDKLAKFVYRCNEKSNGLVFERLARIYSNIFIDEIQDLAGYDLDILKLLFTCKARVLLVGDPRQGTYSTNNSSKNKQFKKGEIIHFFEDTTITIDTDDTTLITNYRSNDAICNLSNKLYPDMQATSSGNTKTTEHDGIFLIKTQDIGAYIKKYNPVQLRYDSRTKVNENYPVRTFGDSKGLEFERVLIYPTKPIVDWLKNNFSELAPTSRSKFYVAITRAMHSVGIIYDYTDKTQIDGVMKYSID